MHSDTPAHDRVGAGKVKDRVRKEKRPSSIGKRVGCDGHVCGCVSSRESVRNSESTN